MSYPTLSHSYVVAPTHQAPAQLAYQVPGGEAYPVATLTEPMRPHLLPTPTLLFQPIEPPRRASRLRAVVLAGSLVGLAATMAYKFSALIF